MTFVHVFVVADDKLFVGPLPNVLLDPEKFVGTSGNAFIAKTPDFVGTGCDKKCTPGAIHHWLRGWEFKMDLIC
jgi:hypothetical protein